MTPTILITGSEGQLGRSIRNVAKKVLPDFSLLYTDIENLDITDTDQIRRTVQESNCRFIINTAAYTAVDQAEKDPEGAFLINAKAVENLATVAREKNALLIHISTDYVFDGMSRCPYRTDDSTDPISVYGKSKRAGELAIQESGCRAALFRTSWLYSPYGHNFVKSILQNGRTRESLKVVNDQYGAPTLAEDLAEVLLLYVKREDLHQKYRIYHYANEGITTWYEFAVEILRLAGIATPVIPITTSEYNFATPRPSWSVFDLSKIKEELRITIPDWKESLGKAIERIY